MDYTYIVFMVYKHMVYTHIYMSDIVAYYINLLSYFLNFHLHVTTTETKEAPEEL